MEVEKFVKNISCLYKISEMVIINEINILLNILLYIIIQYIE